MPWSRLLGWALTGLHWSPATFWQATPCELACACASIEEAQGHITHDDFRQLRAALKEGQWNSIP